MEMTAPERELVNEIVECVEQLLKELYRADSALGFWKANVSEQKALELQGYITIAEGETFPPSAGYVEFAQRLRERVALVLQKIDNGKASGEEFPKQLPH
jgi:hypothetical protein